VQSMESISEIGPTNAAALVIAIEEYDRYPRLERAAASASALAEALSKVGIINSYPEGLAGGTAQELASKIRTWFDEAAHDKRLLFYWSSHGRQEADGLYLVTRDSPLLNLDQTNAVEPKFIGKSAANSKARRILIVLDTCFSGEGLGELLRTLLDVLGAQAPNSGSGRGIAIIASAHALQVAQEGIVCDALQEVLTGTANR
jgi:hypothetical protein